MLVRLLTEIHSSDGCVWIQALYPSLQKLSPLTTAVAASCAVRIVYTLRMNWCRMSTVASATEPPNLKSSGTLSSLLRGSAAP